MMIMSWNRNWTMTLAIWDWTVTQAIWAPEKLQLFQNLNNKWMAKKESLSKFLPPRTTAAVVMTEQGDLDMTTTPHSHHLILPLTTGDPITRHNICNRNQVIKNLGPSLRMFVVTDSLWCGDLVMTVLTVSDLGPGTSVTTDPETGKCQSPLMTWAVTWVTLTAGHVCLSPRHVSLDSLHHVLRDSLGPGHVTTVTLVIIITSIVTLQLTTNFPNLVLVSHISSHINLSQGEQMSIYS